MGRINSREKGAAWEREVVNRLRAIYGHGKVSRVLQMGQGGTAGGDADCDLLHVECKNTNPAHMKWMEFLERATKEERATRFHPKIVVVAMKLTVGRHADLITRERVMLSWGDFELMLRAIEETPGASDGLRRLLDARNQNHTPDPQGDPATDATTPGSDDTH